MTGELKAIGILFIFGLVFIIIMTCIKVHFSRQMILSGIGLLYFTLLQIIYYIIMNKFFNTSDSAGDIIFKVVASSILFGIWLLLTLYLANFFDTDD